jgi:hypothetical protein
MGIHSEAILNRKLLIEFSVLNLLPNRSQKCLSM